MFKKSNNLKSQNALRFIEIFLPNFNRASNKLLPILLAIYFVVGLIFAFFFAYFYHWSFFGYLSPGFYIVILTWPYQVLGFVPDFITYGFAGKPF